MYPVIKKTVSVSCPTLCKDVDIIVHCARCKLSDKTRDEVLAFVCRHEVQLQCEHKCMDGIDLLCN